MSPALSRLRTCRAAAALVLLCGAVTAACGKKGPPLPPFVRLPAAVETVTATRLGGEIYLSFKLPTANVDRSTPIDIGYVDVYGYTGPAMPRTGLVSEATRVARIPVAPPPPEGAPPQPTEGAATIGSTVSIVDRLDPGASADARRFYLVVAFSTRERPGAQHTPVEVRLTPAPAPPTLPLLTYTADAVRLSWTPAPQPPAAEAGAPGSPSAVPSIAAPGPAEPVAGAPVPAPPPQAAPQPPPQTAPQTPLPPPSTPLEPRPEPAPAGAGSPPQGEQATEAQPQGVVPPVAGATSTPASPTLPVNVYRVVDSAVPPAPWQRVRPSPLSGRPLAAPPFTEPVVFDRRTCFVLRSVAGEGATAVESDASPPVCVTPVDTFPPAAPAQLVAVATTTGISLLWEAVADADLAGYLVLRGAPGDAVLSPITPSPVTEVRYLDATAVSGMRYVYAVVAVDGRTPTPNTSPESARVEETAQ